MKTAEIGIALGDAAATLVWRHRGGEHVERVPLSQGAVVDAARLGETLSALAARATHLSGARRITADVALLPPLAEARVLRLPPLRAAEARAVVGRDAGRWFVGVAAPRVVSVLPPKRGARATLAAATSEAVVDAVTDAARVAGIRVRRIVPAHAAWLAAAPSADIVVAVHDGVVHALQRSAGELTAVRRFADREIAAATSSGEDGREAVLLEDGSAAARSFAAAGWNVTAVGAADVVAARAAGGARCAFEGPTLVAERAGYSRRAATVFAAAACVLVLAAAGVHLWGAHRELDTIRERRAEIRGAVEPLLALRDSVDRVSERTARLDELATAAPHWTTALFDLALLLPPETHITRLLANGDTVVIDAEGARAGEALQALRSTPTLHDARLVGAVDRELADGATTVERFRLRAQLARRTGNALTTARADSARGAR